MDSVKESVVMESPGPTVFFAKPSIPSLRSRHIRGCVELPKKAKLDVADALSDLPPARSEHVCPSVRTRRDTGSRDSRQVEPSANCSRSPSLKGSIVTSCSGNNNNNHLPHCGSNYTSPSQKESSHRESNKSGACLRTTRMGVLCAEKHDVEERCECEGMSASSPRPGSLHSFPPSPCESSASSNQVTVKRASSRKRSLDTSGIEADEMGSAVIRRRTHRSPSVGSINGVVGHTIPKEKMSREIPDVICQNGLKRDSPLNGLKLSNGYTNGTRPLCCLGLDMRVACIKCVAHHHPAVTLQPISSPISLSSSSLSPQPVSSSAPFSCQNGRHSTSHSSMGEADPLNTALNSICSVGSNAHSPMDETDSAKPTQTPSVLLSLPISLLSSSAASAPQLQQIHQPTQGSVSSDTGSSCSRTSSSDCSDDMNGLETNTAFDLSSSCLSASSDDTVQGPRNRPLSGFNTHKSLSQPPSPKGSAYASYKSITSSSSLPSLSTLVTEPSSPVIPSTVACRWRGCSSELDASDVLEHIRKHAEVQIEKKTYACLWEDCKVFNKASWSGSWLERHIVSHSGHRPFKCILDNCGQRFHSQAVLERHVNGHFAASQNGVKSGRTREEMSHRMLQKRKRQAKRRFVQTVKRNDFFDEKTMEVIREDLVTLAKQTEVDLTGNALHTTFQGSTVGKRSTKSGCVENLLEFTPSCIFEDRWISESEAQQFCKISVPLSCLPKDTVTNLHSCLYKQHRFRKHRRK